MGGPRVDLSFISFSFFLFLTFSFSNFKIKLKSADCGEDDEITLVLAARVMYLHEPAV